MEWIFDPTIWISFLSLSALEIVLGIDNVVFLALVVQHLPAEKRKKARTIGLALAFIMRVVLLFSLVWIMGLQEPLLTLAGHVFSGRDLMMLAGGLFLIYKATTGMREEMTHLEHQEARRFRGGFTATIAQITVIDLIFSFDSVITAVGLTTNIYVIVAAMAVAIAVMLLSASFVSKFIEENPTIKILALAFIMLIGVFLMGEGFGMHIPKGYIYFGMAFSLGVEVLNMISRKKKSR
jgi:predicted tellurium resistance membrane protein TerC